MKQIYLLLTVFLCPIFLFANGVGIIDGTNETYLELQSSGVQVSIENQVAVVTTIQTFYNTQDTSVVVKYGFPLYGKIV